MSDNLNNPSETTTNPAEEHTISDVNMQEGSTGRKLAVGFLLFLGALFLLLANIAFWAAFTLLNTNGWVAAVGPLSKDPEIAQMISYAVVGSTFEGAEIDQALVEILPEKFQMLSGPLAMGLERLANETVTALITSDAFNTVWEGINRAGHTTVMGVLNGKGDHLYIQSGELTVDFSEAYNHIQNKLGIEDLNLVPGAEGGRLVLFKSQQVAVLQEVVTWLRTFALIMPLLTILAFVFAWFVSLWRRNTLIWIGVVSAFMMFISLVVIAVWRSNAMVAIQDPLLRELGREIVNVLTHGLMVQTLFFMIMGILIAIGAWQSAPDSWLMQWEASRKSKELAPESQN
jgi:hypothetical protein